MFVFVDELDTFYFHFHRFCYYLKRPCQLLFDYQRNVNTWYKLLYFKARSSSFRKKTTSELMGVFMGVCGIQTLSKRLRRKRFLESWAFSFSRFYLDIFTLNIICSNHGIQCHITTKLHFLICIRKQNN